MAFDLNQPINVILSGLNQRVVNLEAANGTSTPGVTPLVSGAAIRWNAASIAGLADNADVTSWTDSALGLIATPVGAAPKYRNAIANGKPGVQFNGNSISQALKVATTSASDALTGNAAGKWTIAVIMSNIDWTNSQASATPISSFFGTQNQVWATVGSGGFGTQHDANVFPAQSGNGVYVLIFQMNTGGTFAFDAAQSTAYAASAGQWFAGDWGIGGFTNGFGSGAFSGVIHEIVLWPKNFTQLDVCNVQKYAHDTYGGAYPWAGQSMYRLFGGDSQTAGVGSSNAQNAYPTIVARTKGWPLGSWSNVAQSGANYGSMNASDIGLNGNAMRNADGLKAVTGISTLLIAFEWYNEANTQQAGDVHANAVAFTKARKAADSTMKVAFGSSLDANSSAIQPAKPGRAAYNTYFDTAANRSAAGIDYYMALHTDSNIGVDGSCPATGSGNTYFLSDNIHLHDPGHVRLAAIVSAALPA